MYEATAKFFQKDDNYGAFPIIDTFREPTADLLEERLETALGIQLSSWERGAISALKVITDEDHPADAGFPFPKGTATGVWNISVIRTA